MSDPDDKSERLRLYGRSGGRPLSSRRADLASSLLPDLAVPETEFGVMEPSTLFEGKPEQVWLEIGFGGGEHLVGQAEENPDVGLIGAEPFLEGIGKALSHIADTGVNNVRLWRGDGRVLVDQLTAGSIDRVFIMFPDPWPKARHRKRRLVQPRFLNELARVMKPRARLRFATDVADYANRALADCLADGRFEWMANTADDWREDPSDHVPTRYQLKRLGDCPPVFLDFVFNRSS